jgi:hypothetical protein
MPLRYLRSRPYAPVKAFYFDPFADNGGDLRQIALFDIVQDYVIATDHLDGVTTAAPFGCPHDETTVGSSVLSVRDDGRFMDEFSGEFQYRGAEAPLVFFFDPRFRFLGFASCQFLAFTLHIILANNRDGVWMEPARFLGGILFETLMPRDGFPGIECRRLISQRETPFPKGLASVWRSSL